MHRIDDPTAVPTLPAPRPQGTPGYFTGGSPGSGGFLATVVRYEYMNTVQEELSGVVEAAAIALDKTNNGQLLAALRKMLRFKLFQDTTFYVSTTGNDGNDGLTPGTAFANGQAAWNAATSLDLNGHNLTIQFVNGTYTQPVVCAGIPLGIGAGNGILLLGNVAQQNLVTINVTNANCITAQAGAAVTARGMTLQATGSTTDYVGQGNALCTMGPTSYIAFDHITFGACGNCHCLAYGGTISSGPNPYTIAGPAPSHISAEIGGVAVIADASVSITGIPGFSQAFAYVFNGNAYVHGTAFAGTATGLRYNVQANGVLNTAGSSDTFLPGDTAGITGTGGQYV
jgi:hypothetical protein